MNLRPILAPILCASALAFAVGTSTATPIIIGSETIPDNATNAQSDSSLTSVLGATRPDNFLEYGASLDDFLDFDFTSIISGQTILSATLSIDITDADGNRMIIREDGTNTLIGTTTPALGSQGAPGPWRAIGVPGGGNPGNQDYSFSIPSSLFAGMESSGHLVLDGSWSSPGQAGVFGSNRARLDLEFARVPDNGSTLALLGMVLLGYRGVCRKLRA